MIINLSLFLFLSVMKLLIENSLLLILLMMEMVTILSFFLILFSNPETFSLTSCCVSMLTVMISESVLSLTIFINLMRISSSEKLSSFKLTR